MQVVIIGAGNWGTTLVGLINPAVPVRLWCEDDDWVARARERLASVAGADREGVTVETMFATKLTADDIVVLVLPSAVVAKVAEQIRERLDPPYPIIVTASKGLSRQTFRTMSGVISDIIPEATVAVISGPNIANEIADGRPAKAMLGCHNLKALIKVAKALSSERFRLSMTRDTRDLELCGVMKGVFAIGAGVIAGKKLGVNFMGLLLTHGLQEILEVGKFIGIHPEHVFGIAGLGDLVATCFSPDSRNYRLGELLAAGVPLAEALDRVGMVVEGAMTAATVAELGALHIRVPLFIAIAAIIERPSDAAFAEFERILLEYPGA